MHSGLALYRQDKLVCPASFKALVVQLVSKNNKIFRTINALVLNTHTSSFPDVWFSLTNITYQNNSLVTLENIGEGDDALLCKTNQAACCRTPNSDKVLGSWFFPNETRVPSDNKNTDFFRDREQMMVRLNRRRGGVEGIYHCEIPDSMNVIQTIYIGLYTADTGELPCSLDICPLRLTLF